MTVADGLHIDHESPLVHGDRMVAAVVSTLLDWRLGNFALDVAQFRELGFPINQFQLFDDDCVAELADSHYSTFLTIEYKFVHEGNILKMVDSRPPFEMLEELQKHLGRDGPIQLALLIVLQAESAGAHVARCYASSMLLLTAVSLLQRDVF